MANKIEDTQSFVRFLTTFLQSLRRTIEVPFEAQVRQQSAGASLLRGILHDVENARLSIVPIRAPRVGEQSSRTFLVPFLAELSNELTKLIRNPDYLPVLKSLRFRMLRDSTSRQIIGSATRDTLPPRFAEGLNAYDAILSVIGELAEFSSPPGTSAYQRELFQLRSIVPAQKIAPAQFEIRNARLAVKKSKSFSKDEDFENIRAAKLEIQRHGEKIIKELQQSNCDRRLLENLEYLQSQLLDETDAIKIGLTNLNCGFMCSAFEHELPSAVSSMLQAHTRGVQLFVGQFPEWNKFLENAATAHLENEDVARLKTAAEQLVGQLTSQPEAVDADVPKTLAFLSQLLDNPSASGKRAAFAVLRSIENLISLVFKYGAEFGQKTISKTIESASGAASKVIVVTLLSIALGSATAIGPIAGKLPEMSWLQIASHIVKKELEELASK
jgi:hypothetical protein